MEDFRLLVFVDNFVASNSSRYVVLSFKIDSSLHLYCYFEKKNKLGVQVVTTFVFVHPLVPSEWCEINVNIDQGLIYGV